VVIGLAVDQDAQLLEQPLLDLPDRLSSHRLVVDDLGDRLKRHPPIPLHVFLGGGSDKRAVQVRLAPDAVLADEVRARR
jgi:hypothetical protein